jgi:RimJ/RimL family protein N-acetyltransferase
MIANDKRIHEMLARLPHPYTKADALNFIENIARTENEHAYAITQKDGQLIGMIGLQLHPNDMPELGYWLGEPYWGKGYATEAVGALLAEVVDHTSISARSITKNEASVAVLLKAGFKIVETRVDDCGQHADVEVTPLTREHTRCPL